MLISGASTSAHDASKSEQQQKLKMALALRKKQRAQKANDKGTEAPAKIATPSKEAVHLEVLARREMVDVKPLGTGESLQRAGDLLGDSFAFSQDSMRVHNKGERTGNYSVSVGRVKDVNCHDTAMLLSLKAAVLGGRLSKSDANNFVKGAFSSAGEFSEEFISQFDTGAEFGHEALGSGNLQLEPGSIIQVDFSQPSVTSERESVHYAMFDGTHVLNIGVESVCVEKLTLEEFGSKMLKEVRPGGDFFAGPSTAFRAISQKEHESYVPIFSIFENPCIKPDNIAKSRNFLASY